MQAMSEKITVTTATSTQSTAPPRRNSKEQIKDNDK